MLHSKGTNRYFERDWSSSKWRMARNVQFVCLWAARPGRTPRRDSVGYSHSIPRDLHWLKREGNQSDLPNTKKEWISRRRSKRKDPLASPIRAAFGWLPTGDLTLSAEVARQANRLSSLPRLLGLVVIGAAGIPMDARFPLP